MFYGLLLSFSVFLSDIIHMKMVKYRLKIDQVIIYYFTFSLFFSTSILFLNFYKGFEV